MRLVWRDVPIGASVINTSLTAAETAELQRLAKGGDVLEVGSAYGYSTVALALVANFVDAVDPHLAHGSYGDLVGNLTVNGVLHKVVIHDGPSQNILPKLFEGAQRDGARYDLVWIDGDHTADVVEHDVRWAAKLLYPDGWLACHDYDEVTCPGVRTALDRLFGGPGELTDTLAVYPASALAHLR